MKNGKNGKKVVKVDFGVTKFLKPNEGFPWGFLKSPKNAKKSKKGSKKGGVFLEVKKRGQKKGYPKKWVFRGPGCRRQAARTNENSPFAF